MDEKVDLECEDCGEAFSAFLQEMAEHNSKVTACPKCGKQHPFEPPKAAKAVSRVRSANPKARPGKRVI